MGAPVLRNWPSADVAVCDVADVCSAEPRLCGASVWRGLWSHILKKQTGSSLQDFQSLQYMVCLVNLVECSISGLHDLGVLYGRYVLAGISHSSLQ